MAYNLYCLQRGEYYPAGEKKNFVSKEEAGNRIIRGERKEKMGTESEHVLNAKKNLKAKNFMLKTQILKPQNEFYNTEEEYYNEYKKSYFAITTKKCGWDCMRHYEILANGCIPYFLNIEN
jgi:hypothetical protein